MANFLGPAIGAVIDREDGGSGLKGALLGSVIQSATKAAGYVAATLAVTWMIKTILATRLNESSSSEARDALAAE